MVRNRSDYKQMDRKIDGTNRVKIIIKSPCCLDAFLEANSCDHERIPITSSFETYEFGYQLT